MGNLRNRETGIVCADVNDGRITATLCEPDGHIMPSDFTEVGNARVTCDACRLEIAKAHDAARDEAKGNDDEDVKALFELLDSLFGRTKAARHAKAEEPAEKSSLLGALLADMTGGEVTEKCVSGTCDHPKTRVSRFDAATTPVGGAEPAVQLSDEMQKVAAVLLKAAASWEQGAREENDAEYAAAFATTKALAGLIAETIYADDEAAQRRFIALSTPSPLYSLLMALRG